MNPLFSERQRRRMNPVFGPPATEESAAAAVVPMQEFFLGGPAPMEPTLTEYQQGAEYIPGVHTPRPATQPITFDAQTGRPMLAAPKILDFIGAGPATVASRMAPVAAGANEVILGAGAVKKAVAAPKLPKPPKEPKLEPGSVEQRAAAAEATTAKNMAMENDPRWVPPEGPEFWPWRVGIGDYKLTQNPKESPKFFPERQRSPEEAELEKLLAKATKEVKEGKGVHEFFPLETHKQQPKSGEVLPLYYKKGDMPEHVRRNLESSGAEERLMESANRAPEEADKWYMTGNYLEDLQRIHGEEEGIRRLNRFGAYMGATTSDAAPPVNVRMATYQMALNDQIKAAQAASDIPAAGRKVSRGDNYPKNPVFVPSNPQYPYGHARYAGTHSPALRRLVDAERIDSMENPKGAEFAGSIGTGSNRAVMDRVMMEDVLQARDPRGKLLQAPEKGTYGYYRDWMDEIAAKNNMDPDVLQAKAWVGHNPQKFAEYKRTLQQHIGDRVNITAKVMSAKAGRTVTPQEVYEGHLRHGWPLLALPPLGGGAALERDGQRP
jgi:hypothetical protein